MTCRKAVIADDHDRIRLLVAGALVQRCMATRGSARRFLSVVRMSRVGLAACAIASLYESEPTVAPPFDTFVTKIATAWRSRPSYSVGRFLFLRFPVAPERVISGPRTARRTGD
jgi:hypothetical protein